MTDTAPPYSSARSAAGLLFVSGQLGRTVDGNYADGVTAQTAQALRNLQAVLAAHGRDLGDVVKTQVFLNSVDDWATMNDEYRGWFGEPYPARSALGCELVPGALVEIEAIATAADPARN